MPLVTTRASVAYGAGFGKVLSAGAVDTGAMFPLGMVQVGSAGASTITFSSIPSTYTHLQIRAIGRTTTAGVSDNAIHIRFNGDSGANYSYHAVLAGTSPFAYAIPSNTSGQISQLPTAGRTASCFAVSVTDILDYANTSKTKTVRSLMGSDTNDSSGLVGLISSGWYSTAAINSITLISANAGTFTFAQNSSFALYGIKGA
jgi:hypothetical protein